MEESYDYVIVGAGSVHRTSGDGIRQSTAIAYLRPAMRRPNLTVLTRASANRLIQDGRQIRGVEFSLQRRDCKVFANKDVILSGGPINSPKLLMLSGIGPQDHLREIGITPTHSLPGVGQNLQDHLEIYLQMACKQPVSLFKYYNFLGKAWVGARWLLTSTGLGASNSFEVGGFIRSRAGVKHPDIQYHFFPMAVRYDGKSPNNSHGFQAHVGPVRSQSKGWVKLRSADPNDDPEICFNYMSEPEDWEEFRAAVRHTREIFAQPALAANRRFIDYAVNRQWQPECTDNNDRRKGRRYYCRKDSAAGSPSRPVRPLKSLRAQYSDLH